jgi:hypothetical protein
MAFCASCGRPKTGAFCSACGASDGPKTTPMAPTVIVNMNGGQAMSQPPPGMLDAAAQGSFVCNEHRSVGVTIGPKTYINSDHGNIPITVTGNTTFSEDSGVASWNFNATLAMWTCTIQKDVGVGAPGTVYTFSHGVAGGTEKYCGPVSCVLFWIGCWPIMFCPIDERPVGSG